MRRSVTLLIVVAVLLGAGLRATSRPPSAAATGTYAAGTVCLQQVTPDQLGQLFVTQPGGVVGADYQRATPLSNGSVLWTFQDAEVRRPNGTTTLVHNIGMIQRGNCFTVLMTGTATDPQPWLFASNTTKFAHWYWPLGAEMGTDGRVYVYMAEMVERGPGYRWPSPRSVTGGATGSSSNVRVGPSGRSASSPILRPSRSAPSIATPTSPERRRPSTVP